MKVSARGIGETVAVIGVIISLIFIGLEFRQSTIAARAASFQELGIATTELLFTLSEDPEIFEGLVVASQSRELFIELPRRDFIAAFQWMRGALRLYETVWLQVELGLLDEEALNYLGWGPFRGNLWLQNMWPELRVGLSDDFAQFIESDWK